MLSKLGMMSGLETWVYMIYGKKLSKSMKGSIENSKEYFRFGRNCAIEFEVGRDRVRGGLTLCIEVNTGVANLCPRATECPNKCIRMRAKTFT
jgi:hypothetical protein